MPLRDLRKYWKGKQAVIVVDSGGDLKDVEAQKTPNQPLLTSDDKDAAPITICSPTPTAIGSKCSLPIFQVWPSQDSPRGEADGQSFVFHHSEDGYSSTGQNDSGIDSVQASPSPQPVQISPATTEKPTPSTSPKYRRKSSTYLHPDHARLLRISTGPSPEASSADEESEYQNSCTNSNSSSTASSLTSVAAAVAAIGARHSSDPWDRDRRRSSTVTARYSLLDALDLEYALLRAAARGSVGPYSLSESLHKLTFTQSLAFPALARGLAGKRRSSHVRTAPLDPPDSGLNAFAKIVTALVLMFVSVMVFAVVYKFVRT